MLALFAVASLLALAAPPSPSVAAVLRAKDQQLLDAVATGKRGVWAAALTDDAQYVDENGSVMNRAAVLASLEPLPPGSTGTLRIIGYEARVHGDVALVLHRDDEHARYHGVPVHAQYVMTETWLRQHGTWRLATIHSYVVPHDPPAATLPAATLDAYAGSYRAAPDLTYAVVRSGDRLAVGLNGGKSRAWRPEAADVFFIPGRPRIRIIFLRDATGAITGLADRREGRDIVWKRLDP